MRISPHARLMLLLVLLSASLGAKGLQLNGQLTVDTCRYDSTDGANIGNVPVSSAENCATFWDSFGQSRPGSRVLYLGAPLCTYANGTCVPQGMNAQPAAANTGNSSSSAASVAPVQGADLGVTVTGPASLQRNTPTMTYTVTVLNNGPETANNIVLTYTIGAGNTFQSQGSDPLCAFQNGQTHCGNFSLAAGDQKTLTLTFAMLPDIACDSLINNQADITSATSDPDLENNRSPLFATTVTCAASSVSNALSSASPISSAAPVSSSSAFSSSAFTQTENCKLRYAGSDIGSTQRETSAQCIALWNSTVFGSSLPGSQIFHNGILQCTYGASGICGAPQPASQSSASSAAPLPALACTDTDNGNNTLEKGSYGFAGSPQRDEQCILLESDPANPAHYRQTEVPSCGEGNLCFVQENVCGDSNATIAELHLIRCLHGCADGACLPL